LIDVARLRVRAKQLGLTEVVIQGKFLKLAPVTLPESLQLRLMRMYPGSLIKAATESIMVARAATPNWQAGGDLGDTSILPWTMEVLNSILK
jgi:transcription-repair coupling factor (superfamily II helicase)